MHGTSEKKTGSIGQKGESASGNKSPRSFDRASGSAAPERTARWVMAIGRSDLQRKVAGLNAEKKVFRNLVCNRRNRVRHGSPGHDKNALGTLLAVGLTQSLGV
jgi:hypothetical protein